MADTAKTPIKKQDGSADDASDQHTEGSVDAIEILKADHRKVEQLFEQFEKATLRSQRAKIAQDVCKELIIHAMVEEEIFYPACREHTDDKMLDEAQVEHDGAKILIREIMAGSPDEPFFAAKVKVLSEEIKHHVAEEERRGDGIFAAAKAGGLDVAALGRRIQERKSELMAQDRLDPPSTVSFTESRMSAAGKTTEDTMNRNSSRGSGRDDDDRRYGRSSQQQTPQRDENGRFTSDDDHDRRSSRSSQQTPQRDENGRFMSDDDHNYRGRSESSNSGSNSGGRGRDDDGRGSSYARGRSDEDDRRYGRGDDRGDYGGRGGSDSSRGGYGGGNTRPRESEDDRRYARSSRDDDRSERSGWFGDSEGHAQASRRGWENSDHEGSGWYGDPQGHADASRRGWETRRREDDDRGGSRSRRRDD